MSDYWGGNARRWHQDAGCLFASVGPDSTIKDVIEELAGSMHNGGDFHDEFPHPSEEELIGILYYCLLTDEAQTSYHNGGLFDGAYDMQEEFCTETGTPWENADEESRQAWYDEAEELPQVIAMLEVQWYDPPVSITKVREGSIVGWKDGTGKTRRCVMVDSVRASNPSATTNDVGYLVMDTEPDDDGMYRKYEMEAGEFITVDMEWMSTDNWWCVESPLRVAYPSNETEWYARAGKALFDGVELGVLQGQLVGDELPLAPIVKAMQWLLDDLADAGEHRALGLPDNPLFDSVESAAKALTDMGGSVSWYPPKNTISTETEE